VVDAHLQPIKKTNHMKKIVWVCGLISGVLVSGFMAASMIITKCNHDYEGSMVVGFASMILAFSLIFVAIKNYRDKAAGGTISFGKGLKIGLLVSLIASTMYVITWMFVLYNFMPDFMDTYAESQIKHARDAGTTGEALQQLEQQMQDYREVYKNPVMVFLFTYMEILPVGILISIIAALILKRKKSLQPAEV
jgi:hypothetical protein